MRNGKPMRVLTTEGFCIEFIKRNYEGLYTIRN